MTILYKFGRKHLVPDTDILVQGVSTLANPSSETLLFCQKKYEFMLEDLKNFKSCCVIIDEVIIPPKSISNLHTFIKAKNPRLLFTQTYQQLVNSDFEMSSQKKEYRYVKGYYEGEDVICEDSVTIEPGCLIDHGVKIGKGTIIKAGAKLRRGVVVGEKCIIKENAVIGSSGFNFERDDNGDLIGTPQCGGVIIKNDVEIGAFCTIASGTIDPTILCDQVKLNDHVHIAHNVRIECGTIIGAAVTIAGSTQVGRNVWIAPNCAIMNQIVIGDKAIIGLSARIHKSVAPCTTMINEGADSIDHVLKFIKYKQKNILDEKKK